MSNDFGLLLKAARERKGMSQRALAEAVGVHFTYISKLENSTERMPSEETVSAIAKALDEDRYSMMLAGKEIPSDFVIEILANPELQQILREQVKDFPQPV